MPETYELGRLSPASFEHLVNTLAMRVLGFGVASFGPGKDGGRDGYFEGEAPYPSSSQRWSGKWYIQSKFHNPSVVTDTQKWLLKQIADELDAFETDPNREWPDCWIVATNVDPSGVPHSGAFDQARSTVEAARPELRGRFHIWGGKTIQGYLSQQPSVAARYSELLTPGDLIAKLHASIGDAHADLDAILQYFIVRQFEDQQYTRLEQAGGSAGSRPGIHKLFIDLPFTAPDHNYSDFVARTLLHAAARPLEDDLGFPETTAYAVWRRHPRRARRFFIKGGPGQGKSTIGQFLSQVNRAAFILGPGGPKVNQPQEALAREVRDSAMEMGLWPDRYRIPITIELKDFAQWYAQQLSEEPRGIVSYLAAKIRRAVEETVQVGTLRRAFAANAWLVSFDGLDEVPHDVKDEIASEVRRFIDDVSVASNLMAICTSRPQGYSGQFDSIDGPTLRLMTLSPDQAIDCAKPLLALERSKEEFAESVVMLRSAIESTAARELMTTPLQAHIMAVVVRDGGKPPDRRWQLFNNFYHVIRKREANRNLPDSPLARLLRDDEKLIKRVHAHLGFVLHSARRDVGGRASAAY